MSFSLKTTYKKGAEEKFYKKFYSARCSVIVMRSGKTQTQFFFLFFKEPP